MEEYHCHSTWISISCLICTWINMCISDMSQMWTKCGTSSAHRDLSWLCSVSSCTWWCNLSVQYELYLFQERSWKANVLLLAWHTKCAVSQLHLSRPWAAAFHIQPVFAPETWPPTVSPSVLHQAASQTLNGSLSTENTTQTQAGSLLFYYHQFNMYVVCYPSCSSSSVFFP